MFEFLSLNFAVAGGLLASVPFVLHLLRKTPARTVPFTVVRFLKETLPKTTRRSSPEHWPLMLLRILAVILLGMAFSRPFQRVSIEQDDDVQTGQRVAVLIDSSASMRRDGIRDQILQKFRSLADSLSNDDVLSVSMYSSAVSALISAEEWLQTPLDSRSALLQRIDELWDPDWSSTETATAMLASAEELSRETSGSGAVREKVLVVITDFQNGSRLQQLQSAAWPENVRIELQVVQADPIGNAGISLLRENNSDRVRITNAGDSTRSQFRLQPFDSAGQPLGNPITVDIAPGQRRTVSLPSTGQTTAAGVELLDDPHPFDNVIDLPTAETPVRVIGHLGSTDPNDSDQMRYYLQRALDGDETLLPQLADLQTADGTIVPPPRETRLIIVTAAPSEQAVRSLESALESGRNLLIALDSVEMATAVQQLLPAGCEVTEADVDDYAMFTAPDLEAPLLRPFADARFSDFSSIRIWKHRRISLAADSEQQLRVLVRFDSGDPAIVEYSGTGGGRVFLSMTGWHPNDSQWALSSRFPPLLNRLLELSWPNESELQILEVGSTLSPEDFADADWTLTRPDESTVSANQLSADSSEASLPRTLVLDQPGRWRLTMPASAGTQEVEFLVNVSAAESRTEPLPAGQLQALGLSTDVAAIEGDPGSTAESATQKARLNAEALESRQKIWRLFLLAAMACLIAEAILSRRIEQRQSIAEPAV